MRSPVFGVIFLICLCFIKVQGDSEAIGDIISSMKNSFSTLSSKREQWFNNYSQMKKLADADKTQLEEILLVSKLAIPLIWHLYKQEVADQKREHPVLETVPVHNNHLPYYTSLAPKYPFYHIEMVLQLKEESDFQIELLHDTRKIYLLQVDYDDRRLVFSDQNEGGEITEQIVVEGENFPAINPGEKFRVNIQVADDCLFTSFWVGDLSMETPRPLPTKHHWCSKVYQVPNSYSINVKDTPETSPLEAESSQDAESSEESSEEMEEIDQDVTMVSLNVYEGLLIQ